MCFCHILILYGNFFSASFLVGILVGSLNLSFQTILLMPEPILTMGSTECISWPDNWTAVTKDGSPAAQFEHTILITKTGAEILTC